MTYRVLIVDDLEDTAVSTAYLLERFGHSVRYTTQSTVALEIARSFLPHIALLDIGMPKMNGMDLCRALKLEKALDGIRCYAISGYGSNADRKKVLDAGFDEFFVKPVSIDQLKRLLGGYRL
ncbi:MAG TPA: response regulator [Burkholderiales bacterium]|nr:response regulator [Burkholderiales bacterium]